MDRVGELGVSEAWIEVVVIFRSGAKVEVLGGRGNDSLSEKPRQMFCAKAVFADSSTISFIAAGLEDLLRGQCTVGVNEMRTQFCLLWPLLRALGLPFKLDALPTDMGDGSHWKGFPLLLLVEEAWVEACESSLVKLPGALCSIDERFRRSPGDP